MKLLTCESLSFMRKSPIIRMFKRVNEVLIFFKWAVNNFWRLELFIYNFTRFKLAQNIT